MSDVTPEMLAAGKRAIAPHLAALDGPQTAAAWDKALAEVYEAMEAVSLLELDAILGKQQYPLVTWDDGRVGYINIPDARPR